MADLNQCTSRTLTYKANISSQLADKIVCLRKQKGRIQSFSELLDVDGMTRSIMKQLASNCVIRDAPLPEVTDMSNNNKRTPAKMKKPKVSKNTTIKKERIAKMNSRFLESLPLLADTETADCSLDRSLMAIYTPTRVRSTPSGEKIFTVYQRASIGKKVHETSKPQAAENRSDNHPHFLTRHDHPSRTKLSIVSRARQSKFDHKLSSNKKLSIQKWLQNTSSQSSRSVLSTSVRECRSRSRDHSKDRISINLSRSGSKSPLLRNVADDELCHDNASISKYRTGKSKARHQKHMNKITKHKCEAEGTSGDRPTPSGKRVSTNGPLSLYDLEVSAESNKNGLQGRSDGHYIEKAAKRNKSRSLEKVGPTSKETTSVDKHNVDVTILSSDSVRHGVARRSLWKDSLRRHHHHHHHHHRRRPHGGTSTDDTKNGQRSKEINQSCVIL